jgi:hypothetical protein
MQASYNCNTEEFSFANDMVNRFLVNELPGAEFKNSEDIVDRISELFIGTRHIRLAGAPSPESQVLIRSIIRSAIQLGKPIPVLSGAGPKKSNSGEIDLAEFSALQKLVCLQERVRKYYEPGMSFRIRLEDTTGLFLEPANVWSQMERYCADFIRLCFILESRIGGQFLHPWRESSREESEKMLKLSHSNLPAFLRAFETGDQEGVQALGWKSGVGQEWKDYLNDRYTRLFPHWTQAQKTELSAKYLANTLARFQAGMTGSSPDWAVEGKHLELSFATPAPGAPKVSSRVFYRTMSVKQTKRHMPYWRAKGFFRMVDGQVKMGLDTCNTSSVFIPGYITLKSRDDELNVRADFLQQE